VLVCAVLASGCAPEIVIGYAPALDAGPDTSLPDARVVDARIEDARIVDARIEDARIVDARIEDARIEDARIEDASDGEVIEPLPEITWLSGGHPGNDLPVYLAFGEWRGRPIDVASVFPDRASWDGIVTPAWPVDMFAPFEGRLVFSLPLYPNDPTLNNADCALGMYDDDWEPLGAFLVNRGRGDSIIRLGWGMNDDEHAWRADTDPSDWVTCFQRIVDVIKADAPDVEIDWAFNPIGPPFVATWDPYTTYPGDDYVDYVGLEAFDMYPPALDEASWAAGCNAPTGLCTLFSFAREHGKKVGVAEWAAVSCTGDGVIDSSGNTGSDNPFFIQKMVETFADNADVMGYEAYFEDVAGVCSTISDDAALHPLAAERYRLLYGPR
jgi:hypothetical protein